MNNYHIVKRQVIIVLLSTLIFANFATAQTVKIKGTIKNSNGYTLLLLHKDGSSKSKKLTSNGTFSFNGVKISKLKKSSLQLVGTDGRYYGPVVLGKKANKASITFKTDELSAGDIVNLGKIKRKSGFAIAPATLEKTIYYAPRIFANSAGKPIGAGNSGITASLLTHISRSKNHSARAKIESNPGEDPDRDGIINALDADDNGNGILDAADPESAGSDTPYVGINFDFRRTLNNNVRSGLSNELIDSLVSGENYFASTFFISLPQSSAIDGGYLICADALTYCRKDTPLGYSGGVSESSEEYRGTLSSLLNSDGYPILERISVGGNPAIVLSMQPRVGRDVFRAGDLYRVVLTTGSSETTSRTFSLPPYFISIPAIESYTTNSVTTIIDYDSLSPDSGSLPGVSSGDPIILGSDGMLTVNFWRPQREPIGSESGYQDYGGLNYGIVIDSLQATCAELYTNLSSELVEQSDALGNEDSPFSNQGATLTPLTDQTTDREASPSNLLTFTVDLKTCLARAGGSAGTYALTLSAAGTQLTGGSNTGNQNFYVTIP